MGRLVIMALFAVLGATSCGDQAATGSQAGGQGAVGDVQDGAARDGVAPTPDATTAPRMDGEIDSPDGDTAADLEAPPEGINADGDAASDGTATDETMGADSDVASGDSEPTDDGESDAIEVGPTCAPCGESPVSAQWSLAPLELTSEPERTDHNPLKGFMTSYLWGEPVNEMPDAMEFLYIPMKDVWSEEGETFDAGLEPLLEAAAGRSHHVVLRIYVDYPAKPPGLPDYLAQTVSCEAYTDHGGGCSPDYDHPLLLEAMVGLITALGERYDGDPRLGVLQIGLLGFWGEWHTWPHPEWFPSLETQNAVLQAAHDAFKTTQLQVRRAAGDSVSLRIGFHDDSFAYSTLGDIEWFFWPGLVQAGAEERWKQVIMGGELRPELQGTIFEEAYVLGEYAQDFGECVETTHASYMLNYKAFNEDGVGYNGAELAAASLAARQMGYSFEVEAASVDLWGLSAGTVEAEIKVTFAQLGVAPFYYELFPSLTSSMLAEPVTVQEDLRTLMPGETRLVTFPLGRVDVALLEAPFEVHLHSEILQVNQSIIMATTTPWTADGQPTALRWNIHCQAPGGDVSLGQSSGESAEDCPCFCDVDGMLRDCAGGLCL